MRPKQNQWPPINSMHLFLAVCLDLLKSCPLYLISVWLSAVYGKLPSVIDSHAVISYDEFGQNGPRQCMAVD